MRVPIVLVWRRRGPLVHAFVTTAGGTSGYCLCDRYTGRVRLRLDGDGWMALRLNGATVVVHDGVRCASCEARARMVAAFLPHADDAVTRMALRAKRAGAALWKRWMLR